MTMLSPAGAFRVAYQRRDFSYTLHLFRDKVHFEAYCRIHRSALKMRPASQVGSGRLIGIVDHMSEIDHRVSDVEDLMRYGPVSSDAVVAAEEVSQTYARSSEAAPRAASAPRAAVAPVSFDTSPTLAVKIVNGRTYRRYTWAGGEIVLYSGCEVLVRHPVGQPVPGRVVSVLPHKVVIEMEKQSRYHGRILNVDATTTGIGLTIDKIILGGQDEFAA